MRRYDFMGRYIRSESGWRRILDIGERLVKLGYKEAAQKPNLFLKVPTGFPEMVVFADLRGCKSIPIWEDFRPIIFTPSPLLYAVFMQELVQLEYAGCQSSTGWEEARWALRLQDIPNGYCRGCGQDILDKIDWNLINEDWDEDHGIRPEISKQTPGTDAGSMTGEEKNPYIDIYYCETCARI